MNEQITNVLRKPWVVPAAIGAISFGGGVAFGYILGYKRRPDTFVVTSDLIEELDNALSPYNGKADLSLVQDEELPDTNEVLKPISDEEKIERAKMNGVLDFVRESEKRTAYDKVAPRHVREAIYDAARASEQEGEVPDVTNDIQEQPEMPAHVSVFRNAKPDEEWDYSLELGRRDAGKPYIIHADEFKQNETGFQQVTITYYALDNVAADEYDTPLYQHENTLGDLRFGHGSGDPNVVYIRNETLEMEYEVLLHQSSFQLEVHGLAFERDHEQNEMKHMNSPKRFRASD